MRFRRTDAIAAPSAGQAHRTTRTSTRNPARSRNGREGMARSKPFADAGVAPMTYARAPRPDQVGFSATGNAALRCVVGG